ncbi:hypothetical protein ASD54_21540 [Rhizobium sp. Root149]|nr:hypothetical protein ASD54_21540 [Rhizobium sp. Root149]
MRPLALPLCTKALRHRKSDCDTTIDGFIKEVMRRTVTLAGDTFGLSAATLQITSADVLLHRKTCGDDRHRFPAYCTLVGIAPDELMNIICPLMRPQNGQTLSKVN